MSKSQLEGVVSHWHKLIENFQTTSTGIYDAVEQALERRKIPGLKTTRVYWSEGGLLSPNREYLRVRGDRHTLDFCAAPFGTGFFFSSWMTESKARFVALYLIGCAIVTLVIAATLQWMASSAFELPFGNLLRIVLTPFVLIPLSAFMVLWLVGVSARAGRNGPELAILTVPIVGWIYERLFAPDTYYRVDTMLMFQSAVHAAFMETINARLSSKGLRALGAHEQQPIFRELTLQGRPSTGAWEADETVRPAPGNGTHQLSPAEATP